jgi:hypothetical protein
MFTLSGPYYLHFIIGEKKIEFMLQCILEPRKSYTISNSFDNIIRKIEFFNQVPYRFVWTT